MSKLIDKLNQASQAVPQPMGFRQAQSASPKLKMLLIASLTQADVEVGVLTKPGSAELSLLHAPLAKGKGLSQLGEKGLKLRTRATYDHVIHMNANDSTQGTR